MRSRLLIYLLKARTLSIGVGALTFLLYLSTMSSSWGFVDGGELSAVASRLGVSHPTGYPATILLGRIAVLLSPARDVLTLNILAVLCTAASVSLLFYLLLDVLRHLHGLQRDQEISRSAGGVAAIAALITGTGVVWWFQGTGFEVYAFHLVITLLSARLFLRYVEDEQRGDREGRTREGTLFALVLGISFTTHLTTVFWLPAFTAYYFGALGLKKRSFQRLKYLLPGFGIGLLPYLYLPISAATDPVMNWGDPDSLSRFFDHVTGAIYDDKMFAGWDVFSQQTRWFFSTLPRDFVWAGILFALAGIVTLFRKKRLLAVWSSLIFAVTVLLSGNYDILDVEPYYLPAIAVVGLWCAVGLDLLRRRVGAAEAIAIGIILVCVNARLNYKDADRSGDRYSEEMTMNMLNTLPANAVIFSDDWAFWVSGSLYAQHVEGVRPDVDVIYSTLLQFEWYRKQLMRREPELMAGLQRTSDEYAVELDAFLSGEGSEERVHRLMSQTVDGIIENAIRKRPVLMTGGIDQRLGSKYERVPNFLALRLVPPGRYIPQEFPNYRFTLSTIRVDPYIAMIHELYARSFIARGIYEEQYGHLDLARRYYQATFAFDPNYLTTDVPDFPLNGEEQIGATKRFFDEMRKMVRK